ncbi:hypothetical protein CCB81_08835 [Armatimonadetes bacterium Uphvl-Ar2]|nr:hypothetical protein CCB81_08835 [Armatimonadetes bacterium Uphvl-Ar2]
MTFPNYWSDEPLEQETDDMLGRGQFAETVARTLLSACGPKSLVVGLIGPWGSGKSTVAHFAANRLKSHNPEIPIIWFEPWLIGSTEAFVREFFIELGRVLLTDGDTDQGRSKRSNFYKYAARITDSLSHSLQIGSAFGVQNAAQIAAAMIASAQVFNTLSTALEPDSETPTLSELRNEICSELRKNSKPVVVVIDDLDRLSAFEIRAVFQLIKACAEFPNLRFLVLFDRAQATTALNSVVGDAEGFLEKIVNQAFDLPFVTQDQRQSYIDRCIETLNLGSLSEEAKTRLHFVSQGLLVPGLSSIRRAKRFFGSASVLLRELRDDHYTNIDLPDFLVLEFIRQFLPELYSTLKDEELRLPGFYINDALYLEDEKTIREKRRQDALPSDPDLRKLADVALGLLDADNPPFEETTFVRRTRVHADRRFSSYQWRGVYFGFSPNLAWFKDEDWQLIKKSLAPDGDCSGWLSRLEVSERRGELARSIADRIILLNLDEVRKMATVVSKWEWDTKIESELIENQKVTRFNVAAMLFDSCLQRISEMSNIGDEIRVLLGDEVTLGCLANALGSEAIHFMREHSEGVYMNRQTFEELKGIVVPKISALVESDDFFEYHEPDRLLLAWRRLADKKTRSEWFSRLVCDERRFLLFVESALSLAVNRDRSYDWWINPTSEFFIALEAINEGQLSEKGRFARVVILESSRKNHEERRAELADP